MRKKKIEMLHTSQLLLTRPKSYFGRFMHLPYRHRKDYYKAPRMATKKNPTANKTPEEYGDTWDQRTGLDWYRKVRNRGIYTHWPWARWTDDPVRHHKSEANLRTFSVLASGTNDGAPEWNYYEAVGEDYRVPSHYPLEFMAPFIHTYTSKTWSRDQIKTFLLQLQQTYPTIAEFAQHAEVAHAWNERLNVVPLSFYQHCSFLSQDMVALNKKKAHRQAEHQRGVLRTNAMQQYFALPYLRGPAMPTSLEQPVGVYDEGKFNRMLGGTKIHPQFVPDRVMAEGLFPW